MSQTKSTLFKESFFLLFFFFETSLLLPYIPMKFALNLKKSNQISISDTLINPFSFAFLFLLSWYRYHKRITHWDLSFATYQPIQLLPFSLFLADTHITNTSFTETYTATPPHKIHWKWTILHTGYLWGIGQTVPSTIHLALSSPANLVLCSFHNTFGSVFPGLLSSS